MWCCHLYVLYKLFFDKVKHLSIKLVSSIAVDSCHHLLLFVSTVTLNVTVRNNRIQSASLTMIPCNTHCAPFFNLGVGGQRHAPAALPPGITRYPLYRRLGGPQCRTGRVWKISPPAGFEPRTVQHVMSRYTDWANPAHWNNQSNGRWAWHWNWALRRYGAGNCRMD